MSVKLGVIGTGGIANHHLKNLVKMDGVEMTAFFDVDSSRAEKAASEFAGAKAFTNLDDMLDDRKLDGVYVCIPPMAHGDAELKLVEREIPFLVEKPLGINNELPALIAEKVNGKKLITSVGYHWRYEEATAQTKKLLEGAQQGM